MKNAFLLTLCTLFALQGCSFFDSGSPSDTTPDLWEPWPFEELAERQTPPCLSVGQFQIVISDTGDYEHLRRAYPPQGEYASFQADGIHRSFELPYQPLSVDGDGEIGPGDLAIYVRGANESIRGTLLTASGDELTSTYPIYVEGDSIFVFQTSPPYAVRRKMPYTDVFTVDPATGRVTFVHPPPQGSVVSISGFRVYETYNQRTCSMDEFDFSERIVLGKSIGGNGCLKGMENEVFLDKRNRKLIYRWKKLEAPSQRGCPEVALRFEKWVATERPPDGYEVVFAEDGAPYP